MSSNRLIYDECAYKKSLQQSTDPLEYSLYTGKYENTAKCRIELGSVGGNGVSLFNGNLVDLIIKTNKKELLSHYVDSINGNEIKVSMSGIGKKFKDSPFEILK